MKNNFYHYFLLMICKICVVYDSVVKTEIIHNDNFRSGFQFATFFKKMGQSRPLFVYFRHFLITISIIEKAQMVCLGFEPGAAGWQAQTKPRSYGGHPKQYFFVLKAIQLIFLQCHLEAMVTFKSTLAYRQRLNSFKKIILELSS